MPLQAWCDVSHLGNSSRLLPRSRRAKIVLIRIWFLINRLVFVRIIPRITSIFIFRACVKTGHLCEGLLKDFVTRPRLRGTWAHVTYLASEPAAFQGNTLPFRSCPSLGEPSWFTEVSSTAFQARNQRQSRNFHPDHPHQNALPSCFKANPDGRGMITWPAVVTWWRSRTDETPFCFLFTLNLAILLRYLL